MKKYKKIIIRVIIWSLIIISFLYVGINIFVNLYSNSRIINIKEAEHKKAVLILGARVWNNGNLSQMLKDRVDIGIKLYKNGKVEKLIMSGDHGQVDYDEVNAMRRYAISNGVPEQDIFMDHAGFDTYDSIYRAKEIFGLTDFYISTQEYHLKRAIYIAGALGANAVGIPADFYEYAGMKYYRLRESVAICKDFFATIVKDKPKFLGEKIDIDGDGRTTQG